MKNKKLVIVEKAYEIDLDKLDEGYLSDNIVCYAESRNKARVELLDKVKYDDWKLKYHNEELNYYNIPIKRRPSYDVVIFENNKVIREDVENMSNEKARIAKLDEILNNPSINYCYIIKGGYYRPNHCGYTSLKFEAGVYKKEEAVAHAKSVREIRLERIDIEEHNKMINEKISELKDRLL